MYDKAELLSIGEVAKLTGAGIQALRYYERKNILKPAFTDPDTGYRYYSLDQLYQVVLITNCVQLGIPLKQLADAHNDMANMEDFLNNCNKVAERKIEILQAGVEGFVKALEKIKQSRQYQPGQIYSRQFSERYYHLQPCDKPLKGAHLIQTMIEAMRALYGENNFSRIVDSDKIEDLITMPDVGCLCKCTPSGVAYFGFAEVPKLHAGEKSIVIPGGNYFFVQNENSLLESAGDIFKDHTKGMDNFIIIETQEPFYSKSKISQPMYELRLVTP